MNNEIAKAIVEKGLEEGFEMSVYENYSEPTPDDDGAGIQCEYWQDFATAAIVYAVETAETDRSSHWDLLSFVRDARYESLGKNRIIY